jgi:2-polyprenyl-6-methoxyphenol hydroxylase-like FAD-dependent oxidoreductase
MAIPANTDVLIVGAGPTGLMLANQLQRRGVRALIVDRNAGPSIRTKALGVQARTLEIYSQLGIVERALELGTRATGANLWVDAERAARVPLGDIGRDVSPFPFLLILGQDDNERLLGDHLRGQGVSVLWDTELVGLAQSAEHVSAALKQADGTTGEVKARWVAGCDGTHSAVRHLSNIDFPGAPYEHVFFVADTRVTGPMVPGELNVYLWRDGFHLFFPMRGADHWRVVGIVPSELRAREDLGFDTLLASLREEVGGRLSSRECTWFSTYRIHHRRAARFRDRRCFLLGDAAHIHSPVGAQGMNTGLQDAYNLAWKLALVVSGRADPELLASYEAERIPVAQRLLSTTDRVFSLAVSGRWLAGQIRTRIMPRALAIAMRFDWARKLAFRTISQTGISYPNSRLSQMLGGLPSGGPVPGNRFPWLKLKLAPDGPVADLFEALDDRRFNLILVGQTLPQDFPSGHHDLILVHEVAADPVNARELERARIPEPSFYLLRPDGHIGLAGARLDGEAMTRYLTERLVLRAANTRSQ